jgi:hypothetical protein
MLAECRECLSDPNVYRGLIELRGGRQNGHDRLREDRLAHLARQVPFRRRSIRKASDVWYNDPLGGEELSPEAAFMARSLVYLQAKQNDSLYAQLWTQYLRVRCLFYRQLVADPAEVGLSTFSRRYQRISQYIDSDFAALAVAFTLDKPELDVKAVEVRSAPPSYYRSVP